MSVVLISAGDVIAAAVVFLCLVGLAAAGLLFYLRQRDRRVRHSAIAELDTEEVAAVKAPPPGWRTAAPVDMSATAEYRIVKKSAVHNPHYPFLLPNLSPMTPLPDVMREPARISRVVMRANDWIESRDQYGFIMPEFCGLWKNVGLAVMTNYSGDWLVPKEKTGYHNITRFKHVRPQDQSGPPWPHPRDMPEVPRPKEMSPLI